MITRSQGRPKNGCAISRSKHKVQEVEDASSSSSLSQLSLGTFDSTLSLPFDANSWKDVRKKIRSIAWIQCDNQNCMKWRKMPKDELRTIHESDKWYCHQNSDPSFRNCNVSEEDVELYDQLARKSGLKYHKSELTPGALVWARMKGYCSWPAIVTPEPLTAYGHMCKDDDSEITEYHVEFLGQPHSHGWVASENVKSFTASSIDKHVTDQKENIYPRRKRKTQSKPFRTSGLQKLKTTYKTVSVQHGIQEAIRILPISPHKRLNMCTYVFQHFKQNERAKMVPPEHAASATQNGVRKHKQTGRTSIKRSHGRDTKTCDFTSFTSSLKNRTKEERLMLDVEMYKRNEHAFDHDVTRFMIRSGLRMSKGPTWQNQKVSLFHLFLAVHERGGYAQVTEQQGWAAVYAEVTETPCNMHISNSRTAKLFYHKFLYPYELYIHGQDFREFITNRCVSKKAIMEKPRSKGKKRNTEDFVPDMQRFAADNSVLVEGENTSPDSLMEMLQVLEENSHLDEDLALVDNIDVTFYNDSTPSNKTLLPLADYELQASTVHEVPNIGRENITADIRSSSSQNTLQPLGTASILERSEADASPQYPDYCLQMLSAEEDHMDSTISTDNQQLLHELEAVQDEITFIDQQMD